VRVLDLSRLMAGNTLTSVLADFGAEVIRSSAGGRHAARLANDGVPSLELYPGARRACA